MNVNHVACAVLGVKIPRRKIYVVRQTPAFEHSYPKDWKHDPVTGRYLWRLSNVCILNDGEGEQWGEIVSPNGDKLKIVHEGELGENCYIGRVVTDNILHEKSNHLVELKVNETARAIKSLLKPHGLYDGKAF